MTLPDTTTLAEVRDWLRHNINDGVACPACELKAKVYIRPLNRTATRTLLALSKYRGFAWTHIPTFAEQYLPDIAHQGGYLVLSQHWGLIQEERSAQRADTGRVGFWRLTPKGQQYIDQQITVPSHARLYGGRLLNLQGRPVTVRQTLGTGFDLRDI